MAMTHISLYRKWRPQRFEEVVGQEQVTRTLQNAIATGRIVHAYLFSGHRGTGKTTTARILAKALNCEHGPTPHPCCACEPCRAIAEGSALDVIELDAASNRGIDEIREIREKVRLVPAQGRYKVYILDEAHMLTDQAENALLKTLEEPPAHAVFVLVTTEPHRLPPTILSRCQRFEFRRIPTPLVVERLRTIAQHEGLLVEDDALQLIARSADGALRDAESVLDQLAAAKGGSITRADVARLLGTLEDEIADRVVEAVQSHDAAAVLQVAAEVAESGRDVRQVLRRLVEHFRDLLVVRTAPGARELVDVGEDRYRALTEQAARFEVNELVRAIGVLASGEAEARWSTQPRLMLELALLRLVRPEADPDLEGLQARVLRLERVLAEGRPPQVETPTEARVGETRPPSTPPPDGGPGLEQLAAAWPRILEEVKHRRAYTHALLSEARPLRLEEGTLVVEVHTGGTFAATTLSDPRHRTIVEEACTRALGAPVRLAFVPGEKTSSVEEPTRGDPLVEQATRLLGPVVEFRTSVREDPEQED